MPARNMRDILSGKFKKHRQMRSSYPIGQIPIGVIPLLHKQDGAVTFGETEKVLKKAVKALNMP